MDFFLADFPPSPASSVYTLFARGGPDAASTGAVVVVEEEDDDTLVDEELVVC